MRQGADRRAVNETVFINGCVIEGRIPVPGCAFTEGSGILDGKETEP